MSQNIFSSHAPTGYSQVTVVSPNEYSSQGRTIGYPSKFDNFVLKISNADGSTAVSEDHTLSDLQGSRLYLYHRPLVNADGSSSTITVNDGVLDTTLTNPRQGYIVFSTLPTSSFTVSYTAAADCQSMWNFNTLQDSVMEIEKILGPTNLTGYPGIRNLKIGIFDRPDDTVASGVLQNAIYLSHLDRNINISSSDDSTLALTRGAEHNIRIGYKTDSVTIDTTGLRVYESDLTKRISITLGEQTGSNIYTKGQFSGAGPVTIGGSEWSNYSGIVFSTQLTGSFYSGAMLRVHGDVAVMGGVKSIGAITVVTTTGQSSQILGDFEVRDELTVYGVSHLIGPVEINNATVANNLTINGNVLAGNLVGGGGGGQTLIDNLDGSEVAWTYQTAIRKIYPNSVICGPKIKTAVGPVKTVTRPWKALGPADLVGDQCVITGMLNATAGPSGAHPAILQLLLNVQIVSGFYSNNTSFGTFSGQWSPGMMDPGSAWIDMLDGAAPTFSSPIYSYTVEGTGSSHNLTRLNVFCPELPATPPATNNRYMLYNPGSIPYKYIYTTDGTTPTFNVSGSTSDPLEIAFDNHVRKVTSQSSNISMKTAFEYSVSGNPGSSPTGICWIVADSYNTDPENSPIFKARATPFRKPNETIIGEVVAKLNGTTWNVLDATSYRPNGFYDSAWIPVIQSTTALASTGVSGRAFPGFTSSSTTPLRVYFCHDLGPDIDMTKIDCNLYLAAPSTNSPTNLYYNPNMSYVHSMFGQDIRVGHGLSGSFIHVPLGAKRVSSATTERDASVFYLDSKLIGVDISPAIMNGFPTGATSTAVPTYARLVVKRDS